MAGYNRTRSVEQLLEKTESSPPSFTVHLHPEFWVLNNGSKFLYQNQIASLLDDIRGHRIPVDFLELFDMARVPFYEGCMVVELLDYRPQRSKEPPPKTPQKTRVVLHPNSETLWADICSLNQRHGGKWTDREAIEVEAKLLLATSPPLCLDPDPHLTRIVNHVLRVSTPNMPPSLKRKAAAMEPEEDGPEKARRERLLAFMAPRDNKLHTPSYRILDTVASWKQRANDPAAASTVPGMQFMAVRPGSTQPTQPHPQLQPPAAPPTPAPAVQAHSPADSIVQKQKMTETPQTSFNVAFVPSNGSHNSIPPQPTHHQFVNQHPPTQPTVAGTPPMQPQVYASLQAAQEALKRTATPSQQPQQQMQMQQHYMQQYHPQTQQQQQQLRQQPQQPQQLQPQQQTQPTQNQPQSQPQHPQQQAAQQRYTQSPNPSAQTAPAQSQTTPQSYQGAHPQFHPPLPTPNFLQQPPAGVRQTPKHPANGAQQQGVVQPQHPSNANQAHLQQAHILFNQQIQQSQQQLHQHQANILLQQRVNMAAQKSGGRATPQIQNQGQGQAQTPQSAAATPSPVRSSPVVTHQQLAARGSPMLAKAPGLQPQQGGPQQQQIPQQHALAVVGQHRVTFTPQYNPSQLRPTIHGAVGQGTQTLAAASPRISARSITPAAGVGDGKTPQTPQQQHQQQAMQMQMQGQQLMRRPTPLQQVQTHHQMQAQQMQNAVTAAQAQGPDTQAQGQAQQQGEQAPTQTQTPVQQPAQVAAVPAQQMQAYYGYQQVSGGFWRMPGMMPGGVPGTPQQQQQQQQVQQQLLQQRLAQQQQGLGGAQGMMMANGQPQLGGGQQMTNQQAAMLVRQHNMQQQQQQAAAVAAQQNLMMMGGVGQAAPGIVMGKIHPQVPAQMQAMKAKVALKKGMQAGKKTGPPQR